MGEHRIPPFDVSVRQAGGEQRIGVAADPFYIDPVLPADTAGLALREARPLLRITGPAWGWALLLLLAVAGTLYWLWRRRSGLAPAMAPLSPSERALESLRGLQRDWQEGRLTAPQLFDGLEGTLRRYAEATRAWRRAPRSGG